jgi:hypothetical protein
MIVTRSSRILALCLCVAGLLLGAAPCRAQEEPSRIGPFVVDVRGVVPMFGAKPDVASSRGLKEPEMPGAGLGATVGVHYYLPKLLIFRFGVGAEGVIGRSHSSSTDLYTDPTTGLIQPLRPVTETFKSVAPQLSLNFKGRSGWSYLSVGLGRSVWSIVPDAVTPRPVDDEVIRTLNYGGGARWFITPHLGFTLDFRFYELDNGTATMSFAGSPRAVIFVVGAGLSLR